MLRVLRSLFYRWDLKLLSLGIAIAMWWGVARDPVIEIPLDVQIEFHNVPENLEISSVNNSELIPSGAGFHSANDSEMIPRAQVRLRGPARVIRELSRTTIHPVIDLKGATAGERTYDLSSDRIQLPHEVEVTQCVPSQLHVTFDRRATREVEVRPRVIGTFASGYRITEALATPATIVIVGPERRVNAIESAITDPVDASGVIGRAVFTTRAYVSDPLVRLAGREPIHVTVVTGKSSRSGAQ
jgi:hypothetical protein